MKSLMPKDLVAIVVLVFIFLFKYKGFDGSLDSVLALIVGYYFVKRRDGIDSGK